MNFKENITAIAERLKLPKDYPEDAITLLDAHRIAYAAMIRNHSEARAGTSLNNIPRKG